MDKQYHWNVPFRHDLTDNIWTEQAGFEKDNQTPLNLNEFIKMNKLKLVQTIDF